MGRGEDRSWTRIIVGTISVDYGDNLFDDEIVDDDAGEEDEEIGEPEKTQSIIEGEVPKFYRTFGLAPIVFPVSSQMDHTETDADSTDQDQGNCF